MPRPPPPAIALIITAPPSPNESKKARTSSSEVGPVVPASTGTPQRSASARASRLVTESLEGLGRGPHEGDAGGSAGAREGRVLREEAVARVDRVDTGLPGSGHDRVDIEVRGRPPPGQEHGAVGAPHVQRPRVVFRVDRHALDAGHRQRRARSGSRSRPGWRSTSSSDSSLTTSNQEGRIVDDGAWGSRVKGATQRTPRGRKARTWRPGA